MRGQRSGSSGPVFVVGEGFYRVKVYKQKDSKSSKYDYYRIEFYSRGQRRRLFRSKEDVAFDLAKNLSDQARALDRPIDISHANYKAAWRAVGLCSKFGLDIEEVVSDYAKAYQILEKKHLVSEAATFYANKVMGVHCVPITVSAIIQEYVAERGRDKSERYRRQAVCKYRLFDGAFGSRQLKSLTEAEIQAFIVDSSSSMGVKENLRSAVVTLLNFATDKGYLPGLFVPNYMKHRTRNFVSAFKRPTPVRPISRTEKAFFQMAAAGAALVKKISSSV